MPRFVFLPLLLLGTLAACDSTDPLKEPADLFEIHLWEMFEDDTVQLVLDGRAVFEGVVSSDPLLGLAKIVPADILEGQHRLAVFVDGVFTNDTTFSVQDTLFVGITYDPTVPRVRFYFPDTQPVYF